MESGSKLGSYEVVDRLGVGGMGEVYLARDTKLGRNVALKVLPPDLVQDSDRLARLPPVPPAVEQLLRRCLERDPRRRLRDIGDARLVLEDAAEPEDPFPPDDVGPDGRFLVVRTVGETQLDRTHIVLVPGWGALLRDGGPR